MRIATLNLWGRGEGWPRRRAVLAEGFRELAPDLAAFQEAVAGEGEDQIAEVLGPRWHVAHFSDRADGVEGISIAARRPLAAVHEVDLNLTPRTAGFPCGTLVAEVDMPAPAGLRFWTGRQSLAGTSVCYRDAWERAHPGEPGPTFSPEENPLVADPDWPFRRIDHILVRCGEHGGPTLGIERCERIFDRPAGGVWASDHFGVTADLAPAASGGTRPR